MQMQGDQIGQFFDASPHYYVLILALGGGYAGNPDPTTPFPSTMCIDVACVCMHVYVRNVCVCVYVCLCLRVCVYVPGSGE